MNLKIKFILLSIFAISIGVFVFWIDDYQTFGSDNPIINGNQNTVNDTMNGSAYYHSYSIAPTGHIFDKIQSPWSVLQPFLLWLIMLLGMYCNIMFVAVNNKQSDEKLNYYQIFSDAFQSAGFFKALLISPIIMYGTYILISQKPDNALAYFYSFQSGFFWLTTFNTIKSNQKQEISKINSN